MAKLKLPEKLKSWKVVSALEDKNGWPSYGVTRVEFDGTKTAAVLTCVVFDGDNYNSDNLDLINEEAAFVKNIMKLRGVSNYLDAVVDNSPSKNTAALFLLTSDAVPLSKTMKGKTPSDNEIVDFGLQLSELLDKLESNNVLHGSINPDNIFVDKSGRCLLGGFTAFENNPEDNTFIAPEIVANEQPDYTTDIYSLGLVMYAMANNGSLPFENESTSRADAVQKRLSKAAVPAPANGSEKLKSVIVIACQPENKNRWKNAGNIKNALSSIKAELPAQQPAQEVIVPESTDFESNVFEEFAFDEFEEAPAEKPAPVSPVEPAVPEVPVAPVEVPAVDTPEIQEPSPEPEVEKSYQEPEIDNRVFDDYELQTKVFNINNAVKDDNQDKDYGDFFEKEPEETVPEKKAPVSVVPPVAPVEEFDGNAFYEEEPSDDEQPEKTGKSKKGLVIGIIAAVVLIGALAAVGVVGMQQGWFKGFGGNSAESTTTATSADQKATQAASTASTQAATDNEQSATTADNGNTEEAPSNVVGTFYDYASLVLEAQGFKVEIGGYEQSDYYEYGYVIAMSPDSSETLKKGSTVTLTISSGLSENAAQSNNDEQNNENDNNDGDSAESEDTANESSAEAANASYSSFDGNNSYLTRAEVNNMSREELNLALNEIYARRGRIFKDSSLSAYFNAQSWYTPKYDADEFAKNVVFNDYEEKNLALLRQVQVEKGYL